MNAELIAILKKHIGTVLTWDAAADIYVQATRIPILVPEKKLRDIQPQSHGNVTFALERLSEILAEMKPLHQAHWNEKEEEPGRPPFNPDYDTFIRYEIAGRALVFTAREEGKLIGNFSLYLQPSMHTQALLATEDTLYLVPEARKGRTAARLIAFAEQAMKQLGVSEIDVTVKIDNKHGRFFQMLGYNHSANGLNKKLENSNVRP